MSPRRPSLGPPLLVALGAAAAAALLASALVDLGDPLSAARARAVADAETDADLARRALDEALSGRIAGHQLWGAAGAPLTLGDPVPGSPEEPGTGGTGLSPSAALLDTAELAASRGRLAEGVAAAREALALAADDRERGLAHLSLARLWSALGERAEVALHRAALLSLGERPRVEGTDAGLLVCLVEPPDPDAALALLEGGGVLPAPADTVVPAGDRLELVEDPWWEAIRTSLEAAGAAPAALERALRLDARRAAAAARFVDASVGPLPGDGRWRLTAAPPGGRVLAARRGPGGPEAWLLDPARAWEALLRHDPALAPRGGVRLEGLADAPPAAGEALAGPLEVPGLPGAAAFVHPDPEAAGRAEARRLRMVRGALVALAIGILGTSLLGARAMARARRLAALRSTFVASVSHDLRTPVQGILLMAETLEQGRLAERAPERIPRYHGRIRREAQRLRRLVEDLLDGARIDRGGGARIEREEVALGPWIDELTRAMGERAMEERAAGADTRVSVERGDLPDAASMDPLGAHRAVWNLFENALLHGRGADGRARVGVRLEATGDELVVTVADEGPGIPAGRRDAVFEPFERLAVGPGRGGGGRGGGRGRDPDRDTGTGLGLAIVRGIARAHGGDARVLDSGRGCRFELRLGIAGVAPDPRSPTTANP